METVYNIIEALCKLSDRRLDKTVKDRLKPLVGKSKEEIKPVILQCIDDCQMYSLSSSFEILAMKGMYEAMLDGDKSDYGCKIVCTEIK